MKAQVYKLYHFPNQAQEGHETAFLEILEHCGAIPLCLDQVWKHLHAGQIEIVAHWKLVGFRLCRQIEDTQHIPGSQIVVCDNGSFNLRLIANEPI